MSSRFRSYENYRENEDTPKRFSSSYNQRSKPRALLSLHSPIGSRRTVEGNSRPSVTFAPSPKPFSRHLEHLRQSLHRRDQDEGWIDEHPMAVPEAPRKGNGQVLSPRQSSNGSVARRLFAPPSDDRQSMSNGSAAAAARIAYLRETLRLKQAECERLKRELSQVKANQADTHDLDRARMECIQLRQENERLKQDCSSLSLRQDTTRVIETLKAKMSAELSGKNRQIAELEQRVRQLEAEDIRATARLDAIRERHSSEAGQLLDKLRQLMDERNRLVLTNAEQAKAIDRLRRDQENQAYSNIQANNPYSRLNKSGY